jgi:hypothetical protein
MSPARWPVWVLTLLGVVAIAAGVLGVIHAPPAIGKATWGVIVALGVTAVIAAVRRGMAPTRR